MSGEMNLILKLSDEELRQALGKTIFGNVANVQDEFSGYTKTIVVASDEGYKSQAIILVRESKATNKDKNITMSLTEKDIIVIAEKGFDVDLQSYFLSIIGQEQVFSNLSYLAYDKGSDGSKLLTASGAAFDIPKVKEDEKSVVKNFDFHYNPQSPLKLAVQGIYREKTLSATEPLPDLPSTLRFGYSGANNFLLVGFVSDGAKNACKVGVSCIPARNVLQNVLTQK